MRKSITVGYTYTDSLERMGNTMDNLLQTMDRWFVYSNDTSFQHKKWAYCMENEYGYENYELHTYRIGYKTSHVLWQSYIMGSCMVRENGRNWPSPFPCRSRIYGICSLYSYGHLLYNEGIFISAIFRSLAYQHVWLSGLVYL